MRGLVLSAAFFSLLICGVLCQDRSRSRYVSSTDEEYEDPPQVNPPPPRRTQSRRVRPPPSRGQQHEDETQRPPPSNTRSPPSLPSRGSPAEASLPERYQVERGPPRRATSQRPSHLSRQRYGPEEAPPEQAEVPAPSPRPPRRRRPSKRQRNENFGEGDVVQDKPRTRDHQTRDHQPSRSSPRLIDDDARKKRRYQPVGDEAFLDGDMQRLPRPAPKQDPQENKRTRDKPRQSVRAPHSRYTAVREDEERPTPHVPNRRPVLEPQPAINRLPPEEHEEPHRAVPDNYHNPGAPLSHAPPGPSIVHQQDRPFVGEPAAPQIRPGISDNSFEVPEEPLAHRPSPEADTRLPPRPSYPKEEDSGSHPSFKEQTLGNERPDVRIYNNRNTRGQPGVSENVPSPQKPDFPVKDNTIHLTVDRTRNRYGPPQPGAPPGIARRNPLQQRDSPDRSYDAPILKPHADQSLRETTGRRVHVPSESEVRLPPNRQPLIAPDFEAKEEEPKVVSYHYQHNPQGPETPGLRPHNEDYPVPSDRLPDSGNAERQPEFPPNAPVPSYATGNLNAPHHLEHSGVEFADQIAKFEASAEAEIDRQIHVPQRTHPSPSNRLPVENADEDSVSHAFPPPRLPQEPRPSIRPPQGTRDVRPSQPVRETRVRQEPRDSRNSRTPQRIRDSAVPHDVRSSRAPQNLRDSPQYRETASSRSRYTKEDYPDAEVRESQRTQRGGSRYQPESPEEPAYVPQRRGASQREDVQRPSVATHHRSRPQYDGESRRPSSDARSSVDHEEDSAPQNQYSSPRNRNRQPPSTNTQTRSSENRRPHYNAPPERDYPSPTERRDSDAPAPKSNFKCPESYGFFPDSRQCDKYYECRNGTAIESLCSDGLAFNEISSPKFLRCDSLRDVDCSSRPELQPPQSTKNCPRRFGLYAHESDCTKFWNCVDGVSTEVSCPPGLVYSDEKATCDWADLVENTCKSEDLLGFTCPEATSAELLDGVYSRYPHPKDCRLHYTCIKGADGARRPRMLSCNEGTVFDPQTGQCTRAENVPGCENYYGTPARSAKPRQPSPEEVVEEPEPKTPRRRRPNKRTRGRAEERY